MQISALKQSSPGRITICLEDGSEIKSTLNVVADLRLYAELECSDKLLDDIRLQSLRALTREKALELLSLRQLSRKELREKLLQKGYDESASSYAVEWLCDNGLLDEASYAAAIVRHYANKGYGASRIRGELIRRGIPKELWDEAFETMPESDGKIDKFIAARLKDPNDKEQIRKISNALYRRGYAWDEIRSALARFEAPIEDEI